MQPEKFHRALSAFNYSTRRWAALTLPRTQGQGPVRVPPCRQTHLGKQRLSLLSWNINAFRPRPIARSKLILEYILKGPDLPDIIFLQEVTSGVRDTILNDTSIRSGFLTTDAEDSRSFQNVSFATMTLLSSNRFTSHSAPTLPSQGEEKLMLQDAFRISLPSKFGRDALCVDVASPSAPTETVIRLINVHLDSLHSYPQRAQQLELLAGVLREPGCSGGIIGGDFNAIRLEDDELIDKHGLVDAWVKLDATKGLDLGKSRRLDKVAMLGLEPEDVEVIKPGLITVPRPAAPSLNSPWSDHPGLRCRFAI